jgi:hypothetical protein
MLLHPFKIGIVMLFFTVSSCSNYKVDKSSVALVPVENIQLSFDLISANGLAYKSFVSSKGNVFEILDLAALREYIDSNKEKLLLSNNYSFLWDTLEVSKKVYLINQEKKHHLVVQSLLQVKDSSSIELQLTPKSKSDLSQFFAKQIGKGLVLMDDNGFIVSAQRISRLDNGNLKLNW